MSHKELVAEIIRFLQQSCQDGTVSTDDHESIEVAIDAIKTAFSVHPATEPSASGGLQAIFDAGLSALNGNEKIQAERTESISPSMLAKAEAAKQHGNELMAKKQFKEAVAAYTEAVSINPTNVLYYSNRAAAYTQLEDYAAAAKDARRAVDLDPSFAKGYSRLGLALLWLGDTREALKSYERGMALEGNAVTEGMRAGYEAAKKKLETELAMNNVTSSESGVDAEGPSAVASSPGSGDSSSSTASKDPFGLNGLGGLGNLGNLGGLSDLLRNPELQKMAQKMMSDPESMRNLMNHPAAQKLKEAFGSGK